MKKTKQSRPDDAATELTIGDVARQSGFAPSALRYYERVGLLQPIKRVNGQRRFAPNAVRILITIRFAQEAGFSVGEIRTLFHGFGADVPPPVRWRKLADKKVAELDALVARVERMRRALETAMQCGCLKIEDCELDDDGTCMTPTPIGLTRRTVHRQTAS